MKRKTTLTFALLASLQACTAVTVAMINEKDTVGKSIDQVVSELVTRGLSCNAEYRTRVINTGEEVGRVNCSVKEKALICPDNFQVPVSFDIQTRKVLAIGKFSQTSCF